MNSTCEGLGPRVDAALERNPFIDNRASAASPDVPLIHETAFHRLTELADEARTLRRGLGVLIRGEAGAGKSHLLARLERWAANGERAWFVPAAVGGGSGPGLFAALLQGVVGSLGGRARSAPAGAPLYRLVKDAVTAAAGAGGFHTWSRLERAFQRHTDRLVAPDRPGPAAECRTAFDLLFRFFARQRGGRRVKRTASSRGSSCAG